MKTFILIVLLSSQAAFAESKFVSASGHCSRKTAPDRASVVLSSEIRNANPKVAANEATELYEKARAEVKKLNLKDLQVQTSAYEVNPEYNYERPNKPKVTGYVAQLGLTVETSELPRVSEVIAIATKLGLQRVGQLQTFLSTAKLKTEQEACLEEAVRNARAKAEKMALAAGSKLGGVISLSEGSAQVPQPVFAMAGQERAMADSPSPQIETRAQDVSVTVQASFALK